MATYTVGTEAQLRSAIALALASTEADTIRLSSGIALTSNLTLAASGNSGALAINSVTGQNYGLSGAFALDLSGATTFSFGSTNTYSGGTTISVGSVGIDAAGPGTGSGLGSRAVNLTGGTLREAVNRVLINSFTISSGATSNISAADGVDLNLANDANSTNGESIFSNNGALVFGSTSDRGRVLFGVGRVTGTGSIEIAGGTLIDNNNALSELAQRSVAFRVAAGGQADFSTFGSDFGGIGNLQNGSAAGDGGGTVTWQTNALKISGGNFSGVLQSTAGIIKTGAGTLILAGANTYTGGTTIAAGTLKVAADTALGAAPSSGTPAALNFTGGSLEITASGFSSARNITLNTTGTVQVDAGNATLTGVIADGAGGAGKLTVTGPGSLTLSTANTYTGGTLVRGGATLVAGHANNLNDIDALGAQNAVVTLDNGTLRIDTGSGIVNGIAIGAGGGTISGRRFVLTGAVSDADATTPGTLTFATSGTLGADNSGFHGTSVVTGGATVLAGRSNAFSPNSTFQVGGGATLNLNGTNQTIASLADGPADANGRTGGTVTDEPLGRSTTLTIGGGASSTFSGVIQGNSVGLQEQVGLTLGAGHAGGTLTLTGANTYTGATTINGGTLQLGNGGTTGTLTSTSGISLGANGTLAVNHSDPTFTFDRALTGTGALQQLGTDILKLTGANGGYSGAVALNAGTIELSHTTTTNGITIIDAAGTGTITFAAGAQTLRLDTAGTLANTIASFAVGDTIDLRTITFAGATLSTSGNTVTVTESAANGTDTNTLTLGAAPSGFQYVLVNDGANFAALQLQAIPPAPPAPPAPTAVADTGSTIIGTALIRPAPGVLANDSGAGGTLTVTAVNGQAANVGKALAGAYGNLTLNADGSYSYAPDFAKAVFTGSVVDHFTYTDTANGQTATTSLDITVAPPSASTLALFGTVVTNPSTQAGGVYGLYTALLNRAPDSLGLENFSASIQAGSNLTSVASALLGSAERGGPVSDATAYVQGLYANALHRTADGGGLNYFVNELNAGVSQATVAVQIATSSEAQSVNTPAFQKGVFVTDAIDAGVAHLYYGLLNRAPDAGGLGSFEGQVKQAAASGGAAGAIQGLSNVASAMLNSSEFAATHAGQTSAAYVDSLYVGALGRHVDAAGASYFGAELAQGVSRATVALQIAESAEAQVHLVGVIEQGFQLVA